MKKDKLKQALLDQYFSGVNDTLDSLIEAAKGVIDEAKERGSDDPKISCKVLLKSFNKLKDLANERKYNRCRMDGNRCAASSQEKEGG